MALSLSSHLLDGMLGRACVLVAVAMLCGIYLWQHYFKVRITALNQVMGSVIVIGLAGVALSLNSTFFQLAELPGEELAALPWQDLLPLLLHTSYGHYWIAFSLLLLFSWRSVHHARWMLFDLLGMVICLTLNSHAGDNGSLVNMGLHVVHVCCVLLWWGGLMMIVLGRIAQLCKIERPALHAFSRLMLPVFLLGVASGGLRLASAYLEYGALDVMYWSLVMVKAVLVLAIVGCAWRLRRLLEPPVFDGKNYDDIVTMEFFFAVLLLLVAAMLTQLPPL